MTPAEAVDLLGKIKFFAGLPAAYLRRIADIGSEEEHKGATTIFQEGDKGDKFYLIIDGAVRISRMVPGMGEEALAVLKAGAYFGEMALIDHSYRSAQITAETELHCLLFVSWVFRPFAMEHPESAWALLEIMVQRVREAESR